MFEIVGPNILEFMMDFKSRAFVIGMSIILLLNASDLYSALVKIGYSYR